MEVVNRVAESDIRTYNLEALWDGAPVAELDLAPWLARGLVLRERDFRQHVKDHDWSQHAGRHVAVFCSTDAIVPTWAFMLVASRLEGVARSVAFGREADLLRDHFARALAAADFEPYRDAIVVVKGCGSRVVPTAAYLDAMQRLQRVARKVMYGEACSSVPLWRRPADASAQPTKAAAKPAGIKPARPPQLG
jgi:hypothetical protein